MAKKMRDIVFSIEQDNVKLKINEIISKIVKPFGNTCHILLPKKYEGKIVKILITEDITNG